jgi:hypothetical protein
MLPTHPVAWLEPPTLSVCLYFSCTLLKGQAGVRLSKRRLRNAREWATDVIADEVSEFLYDHPELALIVILALSNQGEYHRLWLSRNVLSQVRRYTCVRKARTYLKLRSAFRHVSSTDSWHSHPCFNICKREDSGQWGRAPPLLPLVRILPLLWDRDSRERHEEKVQNSSEH